MKKKGMLSFLILALFSVMLAGCSSSNATNAKNDTKQKYVDKDFMASLSKALEARWDLVDKQDAQEKTSGKTIVPASEEEKKNMTTLVDTEISELKKYKDGKFEDSKLQEKAIQYINTLDDQKAALDYITVDYNKYKELYGKAYDKRTQLIVDFVNSYGLKASEKHTETLKSLVLNAQEVTKAENNEAAIKKMTNSIKFEQIEDSYGYKKYRAIVENTTGIDFDYFSLSINLLDKDGVILGTEHASASNWQKGQKAKFEFSTKENFTSMSIVAQH